jgi:hypothetical protein
MAETRLSSLRVTADMDSSGYTRGMAAVVAANQQGGQSATSTGAALAGIDAAAGKAVPGLQRLSRALIDGYGSAEKFQAQVRGIGNALDRGMDPARAGALLDALYRKFGQIADATALAKQGYVSLVPFVESLNNHYSIQTELADRATAAAQRLTQAQRTQMELRQRFGMDSTAGSAEESASVFTAAFAAEEAKNAGLRAQQIADSFTTSLNERLIAGTAKSARESAAVFSAEMARLDEISSLKAEEAGSAFQQALESSLIAGTAKSARESAAVFSAEMDKIDEIARQKAQQAGQNFQAALNDSLGIGGVSKSARESAGAFQEVFTEQERLSASAARLRQEINPVGAAFDAMGKRVKEANELFRAGKISHDELTAANARAVASFETTQKSWAGGSKGARLLSGEIANMGYQINDVITGIALGQSPFMILAQQGGQVYQIFQQSNASLKDWGGWLVGLVTPARALIGGFLGIGTAAAMAVSSWLSGQKDIALGLTGLGRASLLTVQGINTISQSSATAFGLSISEARSFATELASVGKISTDLVGPLTKLGKDFAATFGLAVDDAAKKLAGAFADPVKGADELNQRLGFMDAAMQRQIQNLKEQGRNAEAQKVLFDGIASSIAKASDVTGFWSQLWTGIANAVSNVYNTIGAILAKATGVGQPLEEQLKQAEKLLAVEKESESRKSVQGQTELNEFGGYSIVDTTRVAAATAAVEALRKKIKDVADEAEKAKTRMESLELKKTFDDAIPDVKEFQAILNQLVQATMATPDQLKALGLEPENVAKAIGVLGELAKAFRTTFETAKTSIKIATDAITAFSPADKERIARLEAEERLRKAKYDAPDKSQIIDLEGKKALKQAETELSEAQRERLLTAKQSVQTSELEIDVIGQSIGQAALMRANLQSEQELRREADKNRIPMDKAKLAALMAQNAQMAANKQLAAETAAASQTKFERQTLFFSEGDLQIAQKMRELFGDEWQKMMDSPLAKAMAFNIVLKDINNTAGDLASGFVKDLSKGVDIMDALRSAAGKLGDILVDLGTKRLVSMAVGQFANMLPGGSGDTTSASATSATILASGGQAAGAAIVAAATEAAAILGLSGSTTGTEVAVGGAAAGESLAVGGTTAGLAINGPLVLLMAAIVAVGAALNMWSSSSSKRKQQEDEQAKAAEAWKQAAGQLNEFYAKTSGGSTGTIQPAILQNQADLQHLIELRSKAQGYTSAAQENADPIIQDLRRRANEYAIRLKREFVEGFPALIDALVSGMGPDSPAFQAAQKIKGIGDKLLSNIADAEESFGKNSPQVQGLKNASVTYALGLLNPGDPLSQVQTRFQEIQGTAAELQKVLVALGLSSGEAAKQINEGVKKAVESLKKSFEDDIERQINELSGKGFINSFVDLFKADAQRRKDAATLGLGTGNIDTLFSLSAQKIIDDAHLTGDAFQDLLKRFPDLIGKVHEFSEALLVLDDATRRSLEDRLFAATNDNSTAAGKRAEFERRAEQEIADAAKKSAEERLLLEKVIGAERIKLEQQIAEEIAQRRLSIEDRIFAAETDTSTAAGKRAAFERDAQRQIEEEIKRGGENRVLLEKAIGEEREKLEKQIADDIAQRWQSLNDRVFNALNDTSTLEGKLAAFDRDAQRQREAEAKAGGENMAELEIALAFERLNIIKDFNQKALDEEKRAADERQNAINSAAKNITDYLNGLLSGSQSTLSPTARLANAQSAYNATLGLAHRVETSMRSRGLPKTRRT